MGNGGPGAFLADRAACSVANGRRSAPGYAESYAYASEVRGVEGRTRGPDPRGGVAAAVCSDVVGDGDGAVVKDHGGDAIDRIAAAVDECVPEVLPRAAAGGKDRVLRPEQPAVGHQGAVAQQLHRLGLRRDLGVVPAGIVRDGDVGEHEVCGLDQQRLDPTDPGARVLQGRRMGSGS